ncbi:MAG: type I restriction enzyme HsdR N-terminal domain-containing protein [Bacteroidales bacterium]|nr:type I restriction enzyme HsdR N-terminal domain-containing protein [Bacteroidales bacterium]
MKREEPVRQWFIGLLKDKCSVPPSVIKAETGFRLGDKLYRADILVWDRNARPLAVVECKAPSVPLTTAVLDQAVRYNMVLGVRWIFLTNGNSVIALHKVDNNFVPAEELPDYERMLSE